MKSTSSTLPPSNPSAIAAASGAATLSAAEAAGRLQITKQTLYAYVSRGLLRAHPAPDGRQSRYRSDEVERLAGQRARGRRPGEVVKAALDWGMPVLSSAITLIADGHLYYRGQHAVKLAETATLEQVAALLWNLPQTQAFPSAGSTDPTAKTAAPAGSASYKSQIRSGAVEAFPHSPTPSALLSRFTAATADEATASWQMDAARIAGGCGALLRIQAACLLDTTPAAIPIHCQCAGAWGVDADGAALLRMALALCADHELNASSFTARCVASTGASLRAAVIAGLAALSGPRHGGVTSRVEMFWESLEIATDPVTALRQRLAGGEPIPGFGHPLYPSGDVRARALLAHVLPAHPDWQAWIAEVAGLTGQQPNLDLALVAVRRHLGLPSGAAFGLFALGRTAGWIAHALEQRTDAHLIRPRALYTGAPPA